MLRIITAVLAVGIFACDNGPTGPTATGGEVTLGLFKHGKYAAKSTGEGYNFKTGEIAKITYYEGKGNDIDLFPTYIQPYDIGIYASPERIMLNGEPTSSCYMKYQDTLKFELTVLSGKARYGILVKNTSAEYDADRGGTASEFAMRYRLLDN